MKKGIKSVKSKKIVVKKADQLIELPFNLVKTIFEDIGFSGKLLINATKNVFHEAELICVDGVIHAAEFEKIIFKVVKDTNDIVVNSTEGILKKILK